MTQAGARRVALVDDDADLRDATAQLLSLAGYAVLALPDAAAALSAVSAGFAGVVVTDVRMPGMSGVELFRALHARDAELPVILMTAHGDVDMAVETLKGGAWDYLTKPYRPDALLAAVARAAAARELTIENRRLRAAAAAANDDVLVGNGAALQRLRAAIPLLAQTALDVMIEGATGTGKQMVARLLHNTGPRARHRFVALDCAAPPLPPRELFARLGPLAAAHRGTLFLANLDRADEALQSHLALFAEKRAVALDTRDPDPVDARIVAAIGEGGRARVLPSLYHRLAGAPLRLPTLAERAEDIPLLVAHFAADAARRHALPLPPLGEAARRLAARDWPGNARELEMAVERLVLGLDPEQGASAGDALPLPDRVRDYERGLVMDAIRRANGEAAGAISLLGIPRETFYYRVKRLRIDLKQLRSQ